MFDLRRHSVGVTCVKVSLQHPDVLMYFYVPLLILMERSPPDL